MHTIEAKVGGRWVKRLSALSAASAVWFFAGQASASNGFFLYVFTTYGYAGDCSLCHTGPTGTAGTATKPFAQTLIDYGVVGEPGGDTTKLAAALAQATADGVDSDGDGAPDVTEIADGNPNDPGILPGGFEPPLKAEYGCVGTIAGTTTSTDGAALTAAVLAALVLVFKRRR